MPLPAGPWASVGRSRHGQGAMYQVSGGCIVIKPCGVGVVLLQSFEVFTHVFHGYVPVGDWRFSDGVGPPPP